MRRALLTVMALALAAPPARAEDAPRLLRLIGTAAEAKAPAPRDFVIDARVSPGDGEFQTRVEGWFAAIGPESASGEIEGGCVEKHCALTISLSDGKLALTGDFADAAGSVPARFVVKDDDGKTTQSGAASLSPLAGPVPGLGALAAPDAIDEAAFEDLLMWAQQSVSSGSPAGDSPPGSSPRESLATWQGQKGRPATGLIFSSDLEELRADRAAAQKACGWTLLGGEAQGWSAGYPAALLPAASQAGPERRFASADGKAVLTLAIEPPMDSDAFEAASDKLTADRPGREGVNMTRVNGDLEARWEEGGMVTVLAMRNREKGLARLTFTYPKAREETFSPFDTILQRGLKAGDDMHP